MLGIQNNYIKSGEHVLVTGGACTPGGGARIHMIDLALRAIDQGIKVYMIGTSREFRSYTELMGGTLINTEITDVKLWENRLVTNDIIESSSPLTTINFSFPNRWSSSFCEYGLSIVDLERLLWRYWLRELVPNLDEGKKYMVIIDDECSRDVADNVIVDIEDLSMNRNLNLVVKFKDYEYLRKQCFLEEPFDWYLTEKGLQSYEERGLRV